MNTHLPGMPLPTDSVLDINIRVTQPLNVTAFCARQRVTQYVMQELSTQLGGDTPDLPISCCFQMKHRAPDGKEVTVCTLPPGVCPIQVKQEGPHGEELIVCSQPHCVLVDWQMVDLEKLSTDEVCRFMTPDPVTVRPETPLRVLARMMIDAHIHRVIVVDEEQRPIGVVSSTNILAALAYSEQASPAAC